jgi:hypothetical protein
LKKLTRFLAEWLFERELDEDYIMGTRYGAEIARKSFRMQLQLLHDQATKKDQPGIAKAIAQLGVEA